MVTVSLRISGKVQGVWYRASAKDAAIGIGIKGKVWNERNGDVGVIVQGTREQIDTFIKWCKEGPPLAKVQDVKVEDVNTEEIYNSFEITRN
ncbi:MAG TPA: acylphosphatase [Saprospiraceae bacterium]|nr:acylphosphatase [Saprospiraceae bacterium]